MAAAAIVHSDIRYALHVANLLIIARNPNLLLQRAVRWPFSPRTTTTTTALAAAAAASLPPPSLAVRVRDFSTNNPVDPPQVVKLPEKPPICTADELHYVTASNSNWRLSLWRYLPCPQAPPRNHPLLLLSGVGTNAIGYDLSPGSSFARYMSNQGFDTWILEVRGAGLSVQESDSEDIQESAMEVSEEMEAVADGVTIECVSPNHELTDASCHSSSDSEFSIVRKEPTEKPTVWDESTLVTRLTETFMYLSEGLSGFLNEGQSRIMSAKFVDQISKLLDDSQLSESFNDIKGRLLSLLGARESSGIASQFRDLSQKLVDLIEDGKKSVSPPFFGWQEHLSSTIEDFQKQLDLIVNYDWDFDDLVEDVPAAMEYIRRETRPKDGKLFAIGHSMGGILLYSLLSLCGSEGRDSGLAAVVTLASSLDYSPSNSKLKLLLPLADPAQALNVPVVPLGALLSAVYPLSSRPPYVLSWLNLLISAEDMMHPELLEKLVLTNFCTIPAKLLLQLTTAFREGGLCDRSGKFFYKDHLHDSNVPVLALAGDQDLICPPEAVEATAKLFPENLVTYKVFGEPEGPHYAHYDLVGARLAAEQLYPCVVEFLSRYDDST